MCTHPSPTPRSAPAWLLAACVAMLASACGGGSTPQAQTAAPPAADTGSANVAAHWSTAQMPAEAAALVATPAFHLAPVLLDPPSDADAADNMASAHRPAHQQAVPADRATLRTRGLTVQALEAASRARILSAPAASGDGTATPMAGSSVATYTPAQIRAAYGLPALPAAGATPTAEQAAQLGAGQTIYIVDAYHDPNAAAELAAFNTKFGLPACTTKTIATSASLPLPAPSTSEGCTLSIVYSTPAGGMTTRVPTYDSGWATEIALDVQWAHATAPYARIVLIEAASASLDELLGGVKLANAMGPGPVSMSFGANEGSYTTVVDPAFTGAGMTYLAATGDWGAQVSWPSVSTYVLAVGGTRLNWSGSGARAETGWTSTGGGISGYVGTPAYQNNKVPGLGTPARRIVADVAFNADPASGQYTAVISPGSSAVNWVSTGGTSLSTPQWAGLIAMANAVRAQGGKAALGSVHAQLYGQVGAVPGTYASVFTDITSGSNGSCSGCTAKVGHDLLTGLGTPNAGDLLRNLVSSGDAAAIAPVVTSATINGLVGTALSAKVSITADHAVSLTLAGAPAGMTINADGQLGWPVPVAGSYAVTVTAKDTVTGLSGKGVVTVRIETPTLAPTVASTAITGRVGTALSYKLTVSAQNAVTYSMTGAPAGLTISSTGTLGWAKPVQGSTTFVVIAKDSKNGLSGQGQIKLTIEPAPVAPTVAAGSITGRAGTALSFKVSGTATNPVSYSLSSAPKGMSITGDLVSWALPVAGKYNVKATAKDNVTGLSGTGVYTVTIEAVPVAPVVTSNSVTGKEGTAFRVSIAVKSTNGAKLVVEGVPDGMLVNSNGVATWAKPVPGTYTLVVTATDNKNGLSGQGTIKITIARLPLAPVLASTPLSGVAGRALSGTITVTDDIDSRSLSVTITGLPYGMTITPDGKSFRVNWANPVKGSYKLAVSARNSFGLTKLSVPVIITAN